MEESRERFPLLRSFPIPGSFCKSRSAVTTAPLIVLSVRWPRLCALLASEGREVKLLLGAHDKTCSSAGELAENREHKRRVRFPSRRSLRQYRQIEAVG